MEFNRTDMEVFETSDYGIFKKLKGNRNLEENRVRAIEESINTIGYQPVPILVNEKLEIIDGQGRTEACKNLGLPILFTIKSGIGIDECIAMNIKMRNWNVYDYINSYAEQGKEDYVELREYDDERITIIEVAMCLSDTSWSRNVGRPLREGRYRINKTEENLGCLDFIKSVTPYLDSIPGGHREFVPILIGLYKFNLIDEVHMHESISNYSNTMGSAYNASDALEELQKVYNYRRSKTTRFRDEYLNKMESQGVKYKN